MDKQTYKTKLKDLLQTMVGEDVIHTNFGIGTIIDFKEDKCLVKYDKYDDPKFIGVERFFDYNTPVSQATLDEIDALKVELEFSNNKKKDEEIKVSKTDSKITFDDVIGLEDVKETVTNMIVNPFKYKEVYRMFNRSSGGGILLYGAPGNGKTLIAKAIANEVDAKFFSIKCSDITSKWFGESENKIRDLFNEAKSQKKAIIFFDEFDSLASNRNSHSNAANNRIVSELLAQIDGFEDNSNSTILLIASTNKPWNIDSALLRSGRFNKRIYVGLPDSEARSKLFEYHLKKIPHEDIDYTYLASLTDGLSNADIVEVCNSVKDIAIRRSIESNTISKISEDDFTPIIDKFTPTVDAVELNRLLRFQ